MRETILYDLEKINYEPIEQNKGQIMIVQKDAAVSAVVDLVETDLARTIIRYNHYLLKGDIEANWDEESVDASLSLKELPDEILKMTDEKMFE